VAATGIAIATNDENPAQAISAVSLGVVGLGLGFSIVGSTSAHRSLRWAGGKRSKGLFVTGTVLYSVGLLLGVGATLFTLDEDGPGPAMAGGGLALAIAGFVCLTADADVTRRKASEQRTQRKRRAAAPVPWLAPSSQGLAVGLGGSLP